MPKTTESSPNACGTASAAISIAPIAAEQPDPGDPVVGVQGVGEPGVAGPRPPDRRQHQHPLAEALPGRVGGHQAGDLGEREDEDEVEEELERGDLRSSSVGSGLDGPGVSSSPPSTLRIMRRRLVGALEPGGQLERLAGRARRRPARSGARARRRSPPRPRRGVVPGTSSATLPAVAGIPLELERRVGGLQRLAQHLRAVDDEHAADVGAAARSGAGRSRPASSARGR